MNKADMIDLLQRSAEQKTLLRLYLKYDAYYSYWFPFGASPKLFLAAKEDDFIIDGFSIRRISDIKKIELKDDKCNEILKAEKVLDRLSAPEIDLTDWHSAFLSLQKLDKNIIIQHESLEEKEWDYWIGRIEKVLKTKVVFRHFDADGIWQEEPYEIPFSRITSVTFDSRYVNVFSKYV